MLQNVARNLLLIDDTPYYRVSGAKKARTEGTRGRPVVVSDSDSEEEAPRGFSSSLLEKIFRETQLRAERAEQALVMMRYLADAGMDTKSVLANYFRGGPSGSQQGGPSQTDGLMAGSEDEGGGNNQPGEPRLTPAGGGPAVPPLGFRPATARPPAEVGKSACVVIMTLLLMPRVVHPVMLTLFHRATSALQSTLWSLRLIGARLTNPLRTFLEW